MNPYSLLIPRLNGKEIEERFGYYLSLVKKGIAGFIVFGGELETVRKRLAQLQAASEHPLIIASDLEQGLGQQIEGGTLFPPAMAIASALKGVERQRARALLKQVYTAFAEESLYAGINSILAPVLDINTNPDNPIIATRAFGEDPDSVSFIGCEMVGVLQRNGIIACGKHFPGHGDTEIDSHAGLPVIKKELSSLEGNELMPFRRAISAGVGMIMLGHLSVPSMDPSGRPASLSEKIVSYLRSRMGFRGTIITDAMNMGGIGDYSENEASHMALEAGADIVLHPTDPDAVAAYLRQKDWKPGERSAPQIPRLQIPESEGFSSNISPEDRSVNFGEHRKLSERLAQMAITVEGDTGQKIKKPFLIILNEDRDGKDAYLIHEFRKRYWDTGYCSVSPEDEIFWPAIPKDRDLIVCAYSQTRAWKGKTAGWLRTTIKNLNSRARVFVSFGNPYVLRNLGNVTKIYAYWNSESAQKAVVEKFLTR